MAVLAFDVLVAGLLVTSGLRDPMVVLAVVGLVSGVGLGAKHERGVGEGNGVVVERTLVHEAALCEARVLLVGDGALRSCFLRSSGEVLILLLPGYLPLRLLMTVLGLGGDGV